MGLQKGDITIAQALKPLDYATRQFGKNHLGDKDEYLPTERGAVTKGSIEFRGERVDKLTPGDVVGRGMVQVMEGRRCFGHSTVEENLITGAYAHSVRGAQLRDELERVYATSRG